MENNFNAPEQVIDLHIKNGVKKSNQPLMRMVLLGFAAGFFVAFGAEASSLAMHNITEVGLARLVAGVVFPVGLMMIVFAGGELFTGNCLISFSVMAKQVTVSRMLYNLTVVYFSNFIGALVLALMISSSGQLNYSDGGLGAFTIKVALGKVNIAPVPALISGILCNVLVCVALLMAGAARDITGKCFAIFFPIMAFVISGFEHSVANMYYIPAGIIAAANPAFVEKAGELYNITPEQLSALNWGGFIHNVIPVSIGNVIGGMVFVGVLFFGIYKSRHVNNLVH